MAHCSVLEAHQNITDRPSKRIKRSGGHSLVRRGLAIWVKANILLKMLDIRLSANSAQINGLTYQSSGERRVRNSFIPDKMPSHKAHGTKTKGPVVEQSRLGIFRIMQANHLARQAQ